MDTDVIVLLLGANEGAYALAASFAEYGVPSVLMDEEIPEIFERSGLFAETRRVPGIGYRGLLLRALSDFYEKYAGKSLILIPTTEEYTARTLAEEATLARMYLLPQKGWEPAVTPEGTAEGFLLVYVGRTGKCRGLYGRTVARTDGGEPLALFVALFADCTTVYPPKTTPGFALYAVTDRGEVLPYDLGGALSPLVAFPSALDTSVAEWILNDYVSCVESGENEQREQGVTLDAVFSLLPYRRVAPHVFPEEREGVRSLRRSRLFLTLYPHRAERKNPFFRRALTRFALQNRQKTAKTKK